MRSSRGRRKEPPRAKVFFEASDVSEMRGRWVRISYSQSHRGQPVRPRLSLFGSKQVDHLLPAAALGLGRWLGHLPGDLTRLVLAAEIDDPAEIRVDRVETLSEIEVAWLIARERWPALPDYALALGGSDRRRTIAAQSALDLVGADDAATFYGRRRRPLDPDGLDAALMADRERRASLAFVLPLPDAAGASVEATLRSLAAQTDAEFDLFVVAGTDEAGRDVDQLAERLGLARVRTTVAAAPAIDRAALDAAARSAHDWVGLLRPGDRLQEEAVLVLREHATRCVGDDAVYTDDLASDATGERIVLSLKPDWSPTFLDQVDYVGRLCLFRPSSLASVLVDVPPDDPEPWWTALKAVGRRRVQAVTHLRRLLVWTPPVDRRPEPRPSVPAMTRSGVRATVLIPTRDRADLLRCVIDSLFERTPADTFDLLVIDNDSSDEEAVRLLETVAERPGVTVVRCPGPFNFSTLINAGARVARGDVLVLLNNDCEILDDTWLVALTSLAALPDIGVVGAKLLFPDGRLQHGGVGIGIGGEAGHRDYRAPGDHAGHLDRLRFVHEVSAVTGACLAVARSKFEEVGGFDPAFAVTFNDIDFCLRVRERGYRNLLTPHAVLLHQESASRGRDKGPRRKRFLLEAERFRERWPNEILDDPYFHPLFSTFRFGDKLG